MQISFSFITDTLDLQKINKINRNSFKQTNLFGCNSVLLNSYYTTKIKLETFDVSTSFRGIYQ